MKKIIYVIVLLVAGSMSAQQINFGAKAGVNFATIGGDETEELDGKTGFHVGLVSEILLNEKFAFQPEVLYSTQGAKEEYTEDGMSEKYTMNLDYINIPLLAKYYVTPALNVHLGPQIGILMNAEAEGEFSADGESATVTVDMKDNTKGIDFALAAGLGYKLDMGLFFDARYNLGLSNIWDGEFEDSDVSQRNNVFQFSVGFMF